MIMIYKLEDGKKAMSVFGDWPETMIWSCMQGVMGELYTDDLENPRSVMAILGDFCFFAGTPDREIISFRPEWCRQDFMILVPQDSRWAEAIEDYYGDKAKKVVRYAMKKEPEAFDKNRLNRLVSQLSPEYTLRLMDEELYEYCKREGWCRDLVSQFANYDAYRNTGLGVVALKDGVPISGASSYTAYSGGIEIEIDTKAAFRRRGLAAACGARLILECLARGLYPSWDAQNLWSVALAKKLGYHLAYEYDAFEIMGYTPV